MSRPLPPAEVGVELLILRSTEEIGDPQMALVNEFYYQLYEPEFGNLEPLEEFQQNISGIWRRTCELPGLEQVALKGTHPLATSLCEMESTLLLVVNKHDDGSVKILAGATCELYRNSKTALLGYLITSPESRRRGYGKFLVDTIVDVVTGEGPEWLLVLESEDPKSSQHLVENNDNGRFDPIVRLNFYHKLGFQYVPGFHFVSPAHKIDHVPIQGLLILIHKSGANLISTFPSERLARFCREYYAACYTNPAGFIYLTRMLEWCYNNSTAHCGHIPAYTAS